MLNLAKWLMMMMMKEKLKNLTYRAVRFAPAKKSLYITATNRYLLLFLLCLIVSFFNLCRSNVVPTQYLPLCLEHPLGSPSSSSPANHCTGQVFNKHFFNIKC